MAQLEGRRNLGGDIMIHGKDVSAGCLAIGDEAAEELFTLAAMVMPGAVHTVISPTDFRSAAAATVRDDGVRWTAELYTLIRSELANYPVSERLVAWSAP
jgi:murein L,D-transpeptidase YafK